MMKIKRADNGAVITFGKYEQGDNETNFDEVYAWNENSVDGLIDLLYAVKESLGHTNNKYAKYCIEVTLQHGRGYECKDKDCRICASPK